MIYLDKKLKKKIKDKANKLKIHEWAQLQKKKKKGRQQVEI